MPGDRPLLIRGRSLVFLLAGALVIAFVAGWLRRLMLDAIGEALLEMLPWSAARRLALGLLVDLPQGAVTVAAGALAGRLLVLKSPWRVALALTGTVWLLDLLSTWLVIDQMILWVDSWVLSGRIAVAAATALALASALGWRPRKQAAKEESDEPEIEVISDD